LDNEVYKKLDQVLTNIAQNYIDEYVEKNAQFRTESGLKVRIVRSTDGKCCEWCTKMAGVYSYPVPEDVYHRHDNCGCTVTYFSEKGAQDSHTKETLRQEELEKRIETLNNLKREQSRSLLSGIKDDEEYARRKRIAISNNENCMETTDIWEKGEKGKGEITERKYVVVDGKRLEADGDSVIFEPSIREREIAEVLKNWIGGKIELMPRVNRPEGVQTPDYLINGVKFDLKSPKGGTKNTIARQVKNMEGQAPGLVLDIDKAKLPEEDVLKYLMEAYDNFSHIDMAIVIKANKVIHVLERTK
jgi:hypothetical protein